MNKKLIYTCLTIVLLLMQQTINAQVTVGSGEAPQPYSVLEVSTKDTKGGLRLPQLTTGERNALNFASGMNSILNQGLTIYNTDTRCVEYWDNNKWVSLCLGTASINMASSCGGTVNSNNPPPVNLADGTPTGCTYTPVDNPPCVVPSGQAYQVYLTAGAAYTTLTVDELTSAFSVSFQPNNSKNTRSAVVRIVNNCSGEFQDFVFQQAGAVCPPTASPTLNIVTASLCNSGRAFAYVNNAVPGVNYVWTFGNVIVHTGTYLEADRAGEYKVYADLLGCGTPATFTVTANAGSAAAAAPVITATNSGILCGGGNVILTATNPTGGTVQWFHNGVPYPTQGARIELNNASEAGEWFAVITDGACNSASSNKITLIDQTSTSTALDKPVITVNGEMLGGGALTICQNGTLALEVTNSYPAGTMYEWFANGTSVGTSSTPKMIYSVPANMTNIIVSVQVSNNGANCPSTTISNNTAITLSAPANTSINNGANQAYICGLTPALLVAGFAGGTSYEWYLDGSLTATTTTNTYSTSTVGTYTVRYKNASGCWSRLSAGITVSVSNTISMQWEIEPQNAILGQISNYSVRTVPAPDRFVWTATRVDDGATVTVNPFTDGSSALVQYPNITGQVTISVSAVNVCGTARLEKTVQVAPGCNPVTSVNLIPNGATLTAGESTIFTATAANADHFEWRLNGNIITGATSNTYTYGPAVYTGTPQTLTVTAIGATDCPSSISTNITINVNPDFENLIPDKTGSYSLNGNPCFDVNMTTNTTECLATNIRTNSFGSTFSFDYTFSATGGASSFSDLQFYTSDPSVLIQSVSNPSPQTYRITFRNDINAFIRDNGRKSMQVIAVFKDNQQATRKLTQTINVQDCACCGAFVAPNEWKEFMCHNLGANTTINPFTPNKDLVGVFYQWGRSAIAAPANFDGRVPGWTEIAAPYGSWSDDIKTGNDPCPSGYRVPTRAQWEAVIANNPNTKIGTLAKGALNFNEGIKFGDYLYLTVTCYRQIAAGGLWQTQYNAGFYWSSTTYSTAVNGTNAYALRFGSSISSTSTVVYHTEKIWGFPVRCISE